MLKVRFAHWHVASHVEPLVEPRLLTFANLDTVLDSCNLDTNRLYLIAWLFHKHPNIRITSCSDQIKLWSFFMDVSINFWQTLFNKYGPSVQKICWASQQSVSDIHLIFHIEVDKFDYDNRWIDTLWFPQDDKLWSLQGNYIQIIKQKLTHTFFHPIQFLPIGTLWIVREIFLIEGNIVPASVHSSPNPPLCY